MSFISLSESSAFGHPEAGEFSGFAECKYWAIIPYVHPPKWPKSCSSQSPRSLANHARQENYFLASNIGE
jgi:hypothetical protein